MLIFKATLGHFLYNPMSLARCQINSIDVDFHLQKSLIIFYTNSADKIQSQNYKGGKSALPHAN